MICTPKVGHFWGAYKYYTNILIYSILSLILASYEVLFVFAFQFGNNLKSQSCLPEGRLHSAEGTLHWRSHFIFRKALRS